MITIQDLFQYLQQLLSPEDFTDYCPNGLQVEGKRKLEKACFAISASLATLKEAVRKKADVLVVHHGIFWHKDPYVILGTKKEKLELLLKNDLSLLAYHLPLDAHPKVGNNWKAAFDLGLENLQPFCPLGKTALGVKGTIAPIAIEAFKAQLEAYYGHPAHVALGGKEKVSTVAIISGGAHRYLDQAADEHIDCFITGSFDEPVWDIAHERKINFLALGHYSTERVGVIALMAEVQKHFSHLNCEFIDLFNPF